MKIAINRCYGGFSVTEAVYKALEEEWDGHGYIDHDLGRDDPKLIEAIEKVGVKAASGTYAEIEIVEIPDGVDWHIDDYDGIETIHENHRSW